MRTRKASVVVLAAVIVIVAVWFLRKDPADGAFYEFASAFEARDWGRVYDLSPESRLQDKGVTRDQFVRLCREVGQNLPDTYFEHFDMKNWSDDGLTSDQGRRSRMCTLKGGPLRDGLPPRMFLQAVNTSSGWRVVVNEVPLKLASMHQGAIKDRARIWARAMSFAGLNELPITDNLTYYKSGIERFLLDEGDTTTMLER